MSAPQQRSPSRSKGHDEGKSKSRSKGHDEGKSTTRKKSSKYSNMSDEDNRDLARVRNTETARRNRRKWKDSDFEIEKLYESNQQRIINLERMVVDLSEELKQPRRQPSSRDHPMERSLRLSESTKTVPNK